MPTIEVDEATLASWPEMQHVWKVAQRIAAHDKGRELMQEAVLVSAPDAAGPEARMRKEVAERESARDQKLDAFLAAQAEEKRQREAAEAKSKLESDWLAGRSTARDAGYDGESLTNLEKFMEDRNIADHAVAISHFERLHPPPPPSITGGTGWNFFDAQAGQAAPDLKMLFEGNDEAFLAQAIPAALRDARSG